MNRFKRIDRRASSFAFTLAAASSLPSLVQAAGLPTVDPPTKNAGGGILAQLQGYGFDIVMLVALLVIAAMFIGVCYHAYTQYSEIHTGRKTWGEFGLTVAAGAMLLVIGVWLLTTATGVLG